MVAQSQQGVALQATHSNTGNYAELGTAGAAIKGTGTNGNAIEAHGDIYVTGAYKGNLGPKGAAPFPRPAYDSGWVNIPEGAYITLDTEMPPPTYNNNNFLIKLRARSDWEIDPTDVNGAYCWIETDNKITIHNDRGAVSQIRVWIWYVQ